MIHKISRAALEVLFSKSEVPEDDLFHIEIIKPVDIIILRCLICNDTGIVPVDGGNSYPCSCQERR